MRRKAMSCEQPLLPVIQDEIRASGRIPYFRFMELCLYHPQLGYYNSDTVRLGRAGDFYTNAHTAPVFGRILARHLERSWRERGKPSRFELVELGPGDGLLASELLSWIRQRFPEMYSCLHYTGVEQSARLRGRVEEVLKPFGDRSSVVADWEGVCATLDGREGFRERDRQECLSPLGNCCIIANEFFDALPVHLLVWRDGGWKERYVCLGPRGLAWCEGEPSSRDLAQQADSRFPPGLPSDALAQEGLPTREGTGNKKHPVVQSPDLRASGQETGKSVGRANPGHYRGATWLEREEGWVAEVSLQAAEWMERISQFLNQYPLQGELLVIDYGYTLEEWQQGRFPRGSAMAYRRHLAVDDLLSCPGDQDITAHVDFSQLMEAGRKAGMRVRCFESQARFLMELGQEDEFRDIFSDCGSEPDRLRRAQLLKTLVLPQGMGETFRVLIMETGR